MNKSSRWTSTTLETFQWFVFLIASSVALPIVIGSMFQMNFAEISGLTQRTFFVVGAASTLQALFGHRLPIMEGPAGIWASVFAVMAATSVPSGMTHSETLRVLETTMIISGACLLFIGAFKWSEKIVPVFTPLATGVFFFLLTIQLSGPFLKGMLGIRDASGVIHTVEATIAFATFFITLGFSAFGRGWLRNYAVIVGVAIGWIAYVLFVGDQAEVETFLPFFAYPTAFAFGVPRFDPNILPVATIAAIILISNIVASIVAVNQTLGDASKSDSQRVNRGTIVSGVNHGLAGVFSSIANVPLATSAGFIALTGQMRRKPFIYATLLLVIVSFFPPIVGFVASIPSPIANAVLMASFIQLVAIAFRNVTAEPLDERRGTIVGISCLIGAGTMFLPLEAFVNFPSAIQNVASNGLFVGMSLAILLEQCWKSEKKSINSKR